MKSLITSVIALLALNNATAATTLIKGIDSNYLTVAAVKAQQFESALAERIAVVVPGKSSPVEDKTVLNPEIIVGATHIRTIEEVIAADKKITESAIADEGYLFFKETATEDIIAQDNQIIDNSISTEVRPLYLERTIEDTIAENNVIIEATITDPSTNLDFRRNNIISTLAEN